MNYSCSTDFQLIVMTLKEHSGTLEESIEDAVEGDWQNDWIHSRANHLSYELLAKLAQDRPLKNSALFLKQNPASKVLVR